MAGAVLSALARLQGVELAQSELFDQVLCLEQMMTTGGGWQDQVGGLTPGIKLITTGPGLPQRIQVMPLNLAPAIDAELADRLLLVYTGQRRLAKNLLQRVMGRWMARDPEMVWIQGEIARLAIEMRDALQAGDIDTFGALLTEHWMLNKRMDPGCTNPLIDELFEIMAPYIAGGKLSGAGGGGFAIVIAQDGDKAEELRIVLTERYAGAGVGIWPCAVPNEGMVAS
jgi:fucokinase